MEKKKTAKKTAKKAAAKKPTEKKVAKKAEAKKPTKKVAKKPEAAEKKVAKKVTGEKKIPPSRLPENRSAVVRTVPDKAAKLIAELDKLEDSVATFTEKKQELLRSIVDALGGSSFVHPTTGAEMSIMIRGESYFWRVKPAGK